MNYANFIYTFPKISESCGRFVPKVVGDLFRRLWISFVRITLFKIQLRYLVGVLSVYRPASESYVSRTRQVKGKMYYF